MGIGDKVKDVAHKMGIGHTGEAETTRGGELGSSYRNAGATYGSAGTSGIAAPVVPGTAAAGTAPLGEGVTGTGAAETHTATAEVPVAVQQTTTTAPAAGVGVAEERREGGATCAQEVFTRVEDRPVVKERVEYVEEHRPVEREFVVETRPTGREHHAGVGDVEHLGTQERVVGATEGPKAPLE